MILKCTVCRQENENKETVAEYVFQGESLCKAHFESYLASMIFLTKGNHGKAD